MTTSFIRDKYKEMCKGACFVASKPVVTDGSRESMQDIAELKTKIECDFGAYLGEVGSRSTKKLLATLPEGMPLGLNSIVTQEMLGLHHQDPEAGGKRWLEAYLEYGRCSKYGHLILAGTLENYRAWAQSEACLAEVEGVPKGRLFVYIETNLPPHGKRGWILAYDAGKGERRSSFSSVPSGPSVQTVMYGRGAKLWADGSYYLGGLKGDNRSGLGAYVHAGGCRCEGMWVEGKLHGQGTMEYADGATYEGEYRDGKMQGHGTMVFADGATYDGQWRDGSFNGQGTEVFADGERYEGEWKDGNRNGHGTYIYASGGRYVGGWRAGHRHGRGEYVHSSGGRYVGEFKDDDFHGQGTLKRADGSIIHSGRWEDGNPVHQNGERIHGLRTHGNAQFSDTPPNSTEADLPIGVC